MSSINESSTPRDVFEAAPSSSQQPGSSYKSGSAGTIDNKVSAHDDKFNNPSETRPRPNQEVDNLPVRSLSSLNTEKTSKAYKESQNTNQTPTTTSVRSGNQTGSTEQGSDPVKKTSQPIARGSVLDLVYEDQPERVWFTKAFVLHSSTSINDSRFMWYHDDSQMSTLLEMEESTLQHPWMTCRDSPKTHKMSQLLEAFCQQISLPIRVPGILNTAMGLITTTMLIQYDGTAFRKEQKPFAIRGITKVDRQKQIELVAKKAGGKQFMIEDYNSTIQLHKDEGLLERGFVNYSIIGVEEHNFAFMIIVNVTDQKWTETFGTYPCPHFETILATACFVFHKAQLYINDSTNFTEAAILARQIGQSVYEENTSVAPRHDEQDEDEVVAGEQEEQEETKPKKKKRKSKKSKKAKKQAETAEDEGEEEEAAAVVEEQEEEEETQKETKTSQEDTTPTITISPPTPSTIVVASPPLPRSTITTQPEIFSFLSTSPRLTCAKVGCNVLANASNTSAVVCPRCTAYSYTRYCSREHLLGDVRSHFVSGMCGATLIPGLVDDGPMSMPASALPVRAYVQELTAQTQSETQGPLPKNILERHRQALHRSMNLDVQADYFVFDDLDRIALPSDLLAVVSVEVRKEYFQVVRGSGVICAVVRVPSGDIRKEKVVEVVNRLLRLGWAAGSMYWGDCLWLFLLIRDELRSQGIWDESMAEKVSVQMGLEFGWRTPENLRE